MNNHYHVVLHVDKTGVEGWAREGVVEGWLSLYIGSVLLDPWLNDPANIDKAARGMMYKQIEEWRRRL